MFRFLTALAVMLTLVGCAQDKYIVRPEIVTVKYPVPYCPAIDEITSFPPLVLETLKLTPEDVKDPGKVARAYHIDMINLTQRLHELDLVEQTRRQDAEAIKGQLEAFTAEVEKAHTESAKQIEDAVLAKQKELNQHK